MSDVISEYQKWKRQGEELRSKARQAMESRFRELLTEAVKLAEEYRADFGGLLKPPPAVTAFRYKAGARKGAKQKTTAKKSQPPPPQVEQPAQKPDRKIAGMRKRLETARKKLEAAKNAGQPTKDLEDRIYEIEDDLRLAGRA